MNSSIERCWYPSVKMVAIGTVNLNVGQRTRTCDLGLQTPGPGRAVLRLHAPPANNCLQETGARPSQQSGGDAQAAGSRIFTLGRDTDMVKWA